jgi:hypothetical protein
MQHSLLAEKKHIEQQPGRLLLGRFDQTKLIFSFFIGKVRTRLPVAAK